MDSSIIQGPFSVAPCQTLISITIRNFFIAVCHPHRVPVENRASRVERRAASHVELLPKRTVFGDLTGPVTLPQPVKDKSEFCAAHVPPRLCQHPGCDKTPPVRCPLTHPPRFPKLHQPPPHLIVACESASPI